MDLEMFVFDIPRFLLPLPVLIFEFTFKVVCYKKFSITHLTQQEHRHYQVKENSDFSHSSHLYLDENLFFLWYPIL